MAKKLTKKTKKFIKENFVLAVAVTSVLLNLFFIIGWVTYSSTDKFDEAVLSEAIDKNCQKEASSASNSEPLEINGKPVSEEVVSNVVCKDGEFAPYYDQAVEDYLRDLGY